MCTKPENVGGKVMHKEKVVEWLNSIDMTIRYSSRSGEHLVSA